VDALFLALPQTAKLSRVQLYDVDEGKIKWDDKVIKYLQILKCIMIT
jgi:hypothetical protein